MYDDDSVGTHIKNISSADLKKKYAHISLKEPIYQKKDAEIEGNIDQQIDAEIEENKANILNLKKKLASKKVRITGVKKI